MIRSLAHILFLPVGVEIELIFALWAAFSKIQAFLKLSYLGMKLGLCNCNTIDFLGISIGFYGEFEIFKKQSLKFQFSKFKISQNVFL